MYSPTHRLSKFLDIILRPLTDKVKSYVRDDMDFLKHLPEKVNFDSEFITLDVTSLYTNITHERGIEALEYWIDHFQDYLVEYRFTFIIIVMAFIGKYAIFPIHGAIPFRAFPLGIWGLLL